MGETLLELRELSKYYTSGQGVVKGVDQITLLFQAGEFVAITGESGSGKSTLAHVMGGILSYESGELYYRGRPTSHFDGGDWERYRRDCVSFISQDYGILPGSTVLANVVSALRLTGMDRAGAAVRAEEILRQVELWELRGRRAAKLSSGQKQRLAIARALAKPAPILIADEPTGNLDGENSAKVIQLLSQAAQDRLVILITHEFDEAKDFVTRHIALHDGRVTLDAKLQKPNQPQSQPAPAAPRERRRGLSGYVAGLQLRARPLWSTLMVCFFALTVFGVFALTGTFVSALDDTPTKRYDDSAFPNGDSRRIVVCRADGEVLTEEDWQTLLSVPYVECLERYSYLNDIRYAWREDVDFVWEHTLVATGPSLDDVYETEVSATLHPEEMAFAYTVPLLQEREEFLTAGRLPENFYEIVAAGDNSLLGQTVPVYLQDGKNWNRMSYLYFEAQVVGVTDSGSGLYFHETVGQAFQGEVYGYQTFVPANDLEPGQARMENSMYEFYLDREGDPEDGMFQMSVSTPEEPGSVTLEVIGSHQSTANNVLEVDPATFEAALGDGGGDQVSLTIEDYAYTDRVLDALHKLGYAAISPYREGSIWPDSALAAERTQTLRLCLIALAVVIALQVVVFRAMFGMETESYRILSRIGLNCKTARLSVLWQVVLLAVCGQVIGLGTIGACGLLGIESVARLLRWLPASLRLLLCAVHFAAALITAAWSMWSLKRQVYPNSGFAPDLDWTVIDREAVA